MSTLLEFCSLPSAERLPLVEPILDSVTKDRHTLSDHPSVIPEVRERKAGRLSDPKSRVAWEAARKQIRPGPSSKVTSEQTGTLPKRPVRRDKKKGQTLVEYALILAFISVVAISVLIRLGDELKSIFTTITSQLAIAGSSH
jgi:Flp pilus assembly pilin Flp